ncbi:unnamed protein product [Leptosia nina]
MPGRSTVSALNTVLGLVRGSAFKYVQAIMLDISGAFDNAWWPMMLCKFKEGGCPPNIYRLLRSYFTKRRVGMFAGSVVVWKDATMGCPQGSVLGPTLWNILVDDLLRMAVPTGVTLVAYADDVTVLVEANSRAEIERKAAATLELAVQWGERNRLMFSLAKTQSITLKGKLQRPPVVRLGGESVRSVTSAKLLGVVLDDRGTFAEHAGDIGDRAGRCFGKMSRVSASSWGVRYHALRAIYQGTFVATITYAAAVWFDRALSYVVASRLLRSQRAALVLLTKAYRTTSTPALAVLGGVLPADLEVYRAGKVQATRGDRAKAELAKFRKEIHSEVVSMWQERWEAEERGRDLQRFFPCVRGRLRAKWVSPDYVTSQLLAGHGAFNGRLRDLGLRSEGECPCGSAEEYRDHVLWECEMYESERREMVSALEVDECRPVYFGDLVTSEGNFAAFRNQRRNEYGAKEAEWSLFARIREPDRRRRGVLCVSTAPPVGRMCLRDSVSAFVGSQESAPVIRQEQSRCISRSFGRDPVRMAERSVGPWEGGGLCPYLLSSETTAKGTGLGESAGKEDPVELDSSLAL